jgi:hypothetical protein
MLPLELIGIHRDDTHLPQHTVLDQHLEVQAVIR